MIHGVTHILSLLFSYPHHPLIIRPPQSLRWLRTIRETRTGEDSVRHGGCKCLTRESHSAFNIGSWGLVTRLTTLLTWTLGIDCVTRGLDHGATDYESSVVSLFPSLVIACGRIFISLKEVAIILCITSSSSTSYFSHSSCHSRLP